MHALVFSHVCACMHARLHVNLGLVLIRAIHIHTHLLSLMMKPVCCCSTTFLFYFFSFLSYQAPPSGAGENEEIQAVLSNSSKLFGYSCGRINYCDRVSLPKPGYVRATLIPSMCTCVCVHASARVRSSSLRCWLNSSCCPRSHSSPLHHLALGVPICSALRIVKTHATFLSSRKDERGLLASDAGVGAFLLLPIRNPLVRE